MLVPLFCPRYGVVDRVLDRPFLAALDGSPPPVAGGRPKGCKALHTNATVAHVRRLIEQTELTHKQIAAKTNVSAGTVGRWAREFNWQRHPLAPRASDTVPTERAGRRLKLRMLGHKLHQLAERCVDELWQAPTIDLDRLIEAMQVLNMARLTLKGRGRPNKPGPAPRTGQQWLDRDAALRKTLLELRYGGVKLDRIPEEAMALVENAHVEPVHGPARGRRRRR